MGYIIHIDLIALLYLPVKVSEHHFWKTLNVVKGQVQGLQIFERVKSIHIDVVYTAKRQFNTLQQQQTHIFS